MMEVKIYLVVVKIGNHKYVITTTDMKDKLEAKYLQEQQKENYGAQLRAMTTSQQQQAAAMAQQTGRYYSGDIFGNPLRSRLF